MKRHQVLALLVGGALVAGACSSSAAPSGTGGASSAIGGGKSITIALTTAINTLDPAATATVGTDLTIISQIYSGLINRGPNLKLDPALATSWTATSPTTWDFTLRSGVKFADGEALDASAVKWNFDRLLNPATKARLASFFSEITDVKVIDPTHLEITTSQPTQSLPDALSFFYMLPPKWAASNNPANVALSGTGPYLLKSYTRNGNIDLSANPNYWGPTPAFATVTYTVIPNEATAVDALLSGQVDVVTGISPSDFSRINGQSHFKAGAVPSARSAFIKLNNLNPPFNNYLVRQALNYAVDKQAIISALLPGLTQPSLSQLVDSYFTGFDPNLTAYPYDPTKAKELLAQAGYPNGFSTTMDVPQNVYLDANEVSQIIVSELAKVGVNVTLNTLPFSVFMQKYLPQKALAPMSYLTYSWSTLNAADLYELLVSGNEYAYWNNADFTQAVKTAQAAATPQQQVQDLYTADQIAATRAPVVFLFPQPATYAINTSVVNWQARPDDWVRATEMQP